VELEGDAVDRVRDEAVRSEALPYGVDTIVLRIEWPTAPASRGYNGRMWRMRPLRGWTGGRADQGAVIPIADRVPAASNGGMEPALDAGAGGGTVPNAAPPPLDPNRPFVVDRRYDDALRRVRVTPPHFGIADAPVPAMPDGNYQHGLAYLMLRIASARPEDLPQLRADINALYMQPGAHRTGEELIRAAEDAAEAGGDLRARREILNDIAPIAKFDPLQLAADEFGLPGAVLAAGGAGADVRAVERGESAAGSNAGREPGSVIAGKQGNAATPARTTPFVSNDPGVGELANKLEAAYPGSVRGVNMPVYDSDGRLITDADIRIGNVIVQVKSGRGSGLTRQVRKTATTGLRIIGYGPNLGLHVMRGLRREGFEVYNNEADLLKALAAEVGK